MSRALQILASLLISAGALWYSLHGVELGSFVADLGKARLEWIVPLALCAVLSLWLRARRWRLLLARLGPVDEAAAFHATCIGFMGNMLLPLRAGEVIKAAVIARGRPISTPAALATVALERLCDMIMLGLFAVVTLLVVPQDDLLQGRTGTTVGFVVVVLAAVIAVIRYSAWIEARTMALADRLPAVIGRVLRELGRGFLHGLQGLADPSILFPVIAYSALVWMIAVAGFIAGALALEIAVPASQLVPLGLASTVLIALAVSVPSAPGFLGVFFVGSELALALFGVPKSMGFTFGVLNWLVQMVVIVALGMWSLSRLQLSLGDMRGAARSDSEAA